LDKQRNYFLFNHFNRRINNTELVATIRPIPAGDSSSFIIHDNSSQIAKFIPEKYVEPLVIVARILGFDGIDDYIIHLIKDQLEMFTDTRDNLDDTFQKYMQNMMLIDDKKDVPNTCWRRRGHHHNSTITTEVDDTNKPEEDDSKLSFLVNLLVL
jgi:hypothetical protein